MAELKRQPLRLIDADEPTPQQIALARIEQSHREWSGPNGKPWQPFSEAREKPTLDTDSVLQRTYRVEAGRRTPLWRRAWRWVSRLFS